MENKKAYYSTGKSLMIPLNYKGYAVRANISRSYNEKDKYTITYDLTCYDYSRFNAVDGDAFTLICEKDVNRAIYNMTMDLFAEGYFKQYIDTYDFEMTALNRGIDLLEAERGME